MTPTGLSDAAGISVSYASMILSGRRQPPLSTALSIYDKTGLQFGPLKGATTEDIAEMREALRTLGRLAA
jgi:transcriptional regulator with XRE-family HTH domain